MDANGRRPRGSSRGTLVVVLSVVGLVAVVAIASGGSTPSGAIGAHRPFEGLLDAVLSLAVVGMAVAAVLVVVMLSFFGRHRPDDAVRGRRSTVQSVIVFVVAMALLTIAVRTLADGARSRLQPPAPPPTGTDIVPGGTPAAGYEPRFVVWPVLAVGLLVCVALIGWWLAARGRRSREEPATTPGEALADVVAETLDDLRAEGDPRRAVVAAYARMERAFAACGLPRTPAEAPTEYLVRALDEVAVSRRAATRLTSLYAWARFSGHDVRPEMKDEAIETLEQIQRELAAEDAARHAEPSGRAA